MRKWLKVAVWILFSIFLTATVATFVFRNYLLDKFLERTEFVLKEKHNCALVVNASAFSGFNEVIFKGVKLIPENGDTLLKISEIKISLDIFSLFLYKIRPTAIEIETLKLFARKLNGSDNYSFLFRNNSLKKTDARPNLGKTLRNKLNFIFDIIPSTLSVNNSKLTLIDSSVFLNFSVESFQLSNHHFTGIIHDSSDFSHVQTINLNGDFKNKALLNFHCYGNHPSVRIPGILQRYNTSISFDSLHLFFDKYHFSSQVLELNGNSQIKNLKIKHPKLAINEVSINDGAINYKVHINTNTFELDSSSELAINKLVFHPFIKINSEKNELDLNIKMNELKANDFFRSLPDGMFNSLKGIQTEGYLSYRLKFHILRERPDSLQFSSFLQKNNFKIKKFGEDYLPKINTSFQYTAYEKGKPVKAFVIGPENKDFTPLSHISPHLRNAVLTSEDGSFFFHRGFNEEAFRKSIVDNIHKGRFARGGSTITMQLVKNVYLNRNKTISRKLEEVLIVWLIENNYLSSKERMYEVYLNIIEWGPQVYGIREAANFYFKKHPYDLTLAESIFLSSIVPRPKAFKYSFGSDGKLKSHLEAYYRLVSNHMLKKGYITEEELNSLNPSDVELTGRAKVLISPIEEIPLDFFEEE